MSVASLTRVVHFPAGHRYHRPEWSERRNREVFGRCARPHGHDYRIEVTVAGPVDPETGMVLDLGELDRLLEERIRKPMDHAFLNDLEDFAGDRLIPTTENIARVAWERIACGLPSGCRLERVRVREGRDLWSDYTGGGSTG